MTQYQVYQVWAAERTRTIGEQRAADARLGELAASTSRSVSNAARHLKVAASLVSRVRRLARPVPGHGAQVHCKTEG
jgi:hypothetical protein